MDLLARAYEQAFRDQVTLTDEAVAVERIGAPSRWCPARPGTARSRPPKTWPGPKTSWPAAGGSGGLSYRVGTGFDAHRLAPGRRLMLGGVLIPSDRGLEGHSDGDCLIHAICDALLGAAAAGDMGEHFPSADPRFEGAPSRIFLEHVAGLLREKRLRGRERRRHGHRPGPGPRSSSAGDARSLERHARGGPGCRFGQGQERRPPGRARSGRGDRGPGRGPARGGRVSGGACRESAWVRRRLARPRPARARRDGPQDRGFEARGRKGGPRPTAPPAAPDPARGERGHREGDARASSAAPPTRRSASRSRTASSVSDPTTLAAAPTSA